MANRNKLIEGVPNVIAEFGPGDSLGTGLAALLSGASKYYALDIVKFAYTEKNIEIFDHLIELFSNRSDIPGHEEFPEIKPELDSYEFPHHILDDKGMQASLQLDRLSNIRTALLNLSQNQVEISYFVPWNDVPKVRQGTVDMLLSQAVLEHVDELSEAYSVSHSWLKVGGIMSHTIDFRSHGTSAKWNGHWSYKEWMWKLIRGRLPYLINRHPHSEHLRYINTLGMDIICNIATKNTSGITREQLSPFFKNLSEDDFLTDTVFVQALKR